MLDAVQPSAPRLPEEAPDGVLSEALAGLTAQPRTLPAKLFYDPEGCRLFGLITTLPEYYPTRTEQALLAEVAPTIVAGITADTVLVEYGASDEAKARQLLDAAPGGTFAAYVPIDVASDALDQLRGRLATALPSLVVHTLAADFLRPLTLPSAVADLPRLGFFPGSTIGNLEPDVAVALLENMHRTLGAGARLLVGADMCRDPARLLPAYDDPQGVTAAFNRNILAHLNRVAGADFDLAAFDHRAVWNAERSRIEMHLVSRRPQTVHLGGTTIRLEGGEGIHTENSHKYAPGALEALAARAGWFAEALWTDADRLFALHLFAATDILPGGRPK